MNTMSERLASIEKRFSNYFDDWWDKKDLDLKLKTMWQEKKYTEIMNDTYDLPYRATNAEYFKNTKVLKELLIECCETFEMCIKLADKNKTTVLKEIIKSQLESIDAAIIKEQDI